MLLLMRTMISSTTVASLGWLGAGAADAGGTVPAGSADCACCPNRSEPLRETDNVKRSTDFFINNLVRHTRTHGGLT